MSDIQCEVINVPTLLDESCQKDLRNNGTLQKMVQSDDLIWQQMELGHFISLIDNKQLYFTRFDTFADDDELTSSKYTSILLEPYSNLSKDSNGLENCKKKFQQLLEKNEKQLYISCWYNNRNLSDIAFKQYAEKVGNKKNESDSDDKSAIKKNKIGIAIGTSVRNLCSVLNDSFKKEVSSSYTFSVEKCLVGNVQYMNIGELTSKRVFEESQIFAPAYLKGMQYFMDHEMRVCLKVKNYQDGAFKLPIKSPNSWIEYIAIRFGDKAIDDNIDDYNKFKSYVKTDYKIIEGLAHSPLNESGFIVYKKI